MFNDYTYPYNINEFPDIQELQDGWRKFMDDFKFPTYTFTIYETNSKQDNENEENNMSNLTKIYNNLNLSEDEQLARKHGALDEKGLLTEEGKDLLLNILLKDTDIKKKFFDAIKAIEAKTKEDKCKKQK